MTAYFSQQMDNSCFVVAVANCLVHLGAPVPDLEAAKDIALCRGGSTIRHAEVVAFMKAPLVRDTAERVLHSGGVLSILHPIFNGHAVFVAPVHGDLISAVNSWLGPVEMIVDRSEIEPFVWNGSVGGHWRMLR